VCVCVCVMLRSLYTAAPEGYVVCVQLKSMLPAYLEQYFWKLNPESTGPTARRFEFQVAMIETGRPRSAYTPGPQHFENGRGGGGGGGGRVQGAGRKAGGGERRL
jgi:hypothetical protein